MSDENCPPTAQVAADAVESAIEGKLAALSADVSSLLPAEAGDGASTSEADYWREKFNELSRVRLTEPEEQAAQARRDAEATVERIESMISQFEQAETAERKALQGARVVAAKAEAAAIRARKAEKTAKAEAPAAEGDKVKHLKRLLRAYQRMTGIVLQLQEDDGAEGEESVLCTAINRQKKRATQFSLDMSGDSATFEPYANVKHLPPDLRADFDCSTSQLPVLMAKVNCFLYREED